MSVPELRPYQLDLAERVRAARVNGARIIVVQAPTGSGKTSFASYIAKQSATKGSKVLFLVHRRRLVDQISGRLHEFQVEHGTIMRGDQAYAAPVQVASRDTVTSRAFRHDWLGLPPADLIFVDEAHHAADPQSDYRQILEHYPKATILLLTATPVSPGGAGLGPWAQAIECCTPISQLVKDGYLVPMKYYAPDRKHHKNGKAKRGIAGDLVQSWKDLAEGLPTILFVSRVQHSRDAVEAYQAAGITAAHIDADTPDDERDRIFDAVESGKIKVVSNVGIVKEGVDVPCLGCAQLYLNIGGIVTLIQDVGRVMRPFPGKTHGICLDHSGAIFHYGFPDEDIAWTLEGNVDAEFKKKHDAGLTAPVHYCKHCETLFSSLTCPECGKLPAKPPKSIFAPPPIDATDELLTEAQKGERSVHDREEKVKHWMRCLAVAANKGKSFSVAVSIFRRKYNEWPNGFPCVPDRYGWQQKVTDVYPNFARRKAVS